MCVSTCDELIYVYMCADVLACVCDMHVHAR
jgi:hypothetical protein